MIAENNFRTLFNANGFCFIYNYTSVVSAAYTSGKSTSDTPVGLWPQWFLRNAVNSLTLANMVFTTTHASIQQAFTYLDDERLGTNWPTTFSYTGFFSRHPLCFYARRRCCYVWVRTSILRLERSFSSIQFIPVMFICLIHIIRPVLGHFPLCVIPMCSQNYVFLVVI